jgi:hypothetical protein
MSDSTPTERFDAQTGNDDEPKSKTLLYVLIGVGGALLIAVIILLVVLLTRPATSTNVSETPIPTATTSETPSEVPSESPTPVSTPTASTPTETAAPPPAPPAAVPGFDSFSAPSHAGCQDGDDQKPLTFTWSSDDATKAYIGVGTNNAKTGAYEGDLPPSYTYTNLNYQCSQASQIYTVTLEDGAGHLTHKTVTITK